MLVLSGAETLQMTTASIFKDLRMLLDLVRVRLSVKGNSDYRANSAQFQIRLTYGAELGKPES